MLCIYGAIVTQTGVLATLFKDGDFDDGERRRRHDSSACICTYVVCISLVREQKNIEF